MSHRPASQNLAELDWAVGSRLVAARAVAHSVGDCRGMFFFPIGLHARTADKLIRIAREFGSKI
jgi:hypothetical protein